MTLEYQEGELAQTELVPDLEQVELTAWEDGDVSYIHTSIEGEWIRVSDPSILVDTEDNI